MRIKHALIAALALLLGTTAMAQSKKSFTLEDLMWGGNNYANIMPKYYGTAFWGDRLLKLNVDEVSTLTNDKGQKEKSSVLFTTDQLNAAIDTRNSPMPTSLKCISALPSSACSTTGSSVRSYGAHPAPRANRLRTSASLPRPKLM